MTTNFSRFIILFTFLLTALVGCQVQDKPFLPKGAPILAADEEECPEGENRRFDLRSISRTVLGEQPDYSFDLNTANFPFTTVDCVCRVEEYNINFQENSGLPKKEDILVTNSEGAEVPFEIVNYNSMDIIQVTEFDLLQDIRLELHVSWKFPNVSAEFVSGTGLCVIDNIGDPPGDTTLARVTPWILEDQPGPDPGQLIRKILIPKTMTTP